jgi:DNA-binding NarL/FixJ family response regulator
MLRLFTQGLRNREIAEKLVISARAIGNPISNSFDSRDATDGSGSLRRKDT